MAYSDTKTLREQSAGIAGVIAVHTGLGALVVLGLAATVVVTETPKPQPTPTINFDLPPPPPKPDTVEPDKPATATKTPDRNSDPIVLPPAPFTAPTTGPQLGDVEPYFPPIGGTFGDIDLGGLGAGGSKVTPTPTPTPTIAFDPIAASPKNNASRWITDSDYRSSWVRRDMTGVARFSVGVGTDGRVTNCEVTSSTGHRALDAATCSLISKRARFNPAKDGNGKTVEGSYSSSIRWILPE